MTSPRRGQNPAEHVMSSGPVYFTVLAPASQA